MKHATFNNSELIVRHLKAPNLEVQKTITYYSPILDSETGCGTLKIEKGFVCDLTSLRLLGLVSRGDWDMASVVHDKLYKHPWHNGIRITKEMADDVYEEAMIALKTNPIRVKAYRLGVRLFGWPAWWSHRRKDRKKIVNQP